MPDSQSQTEKLPKKMKPDRKSVMAAIEKAEGKS
jgi:hypothetical protein